MICGIALALGLYNPLTYLLYRLIPGWDLFRVPARWLEATMLGLALLAALGAERLQVRGQRSEVRGRRRTLSPWVWMVGGGALLVGAALVVVARPNLVTLGGWALTAVALVLLLAGRRRIGRWTLPLLAMLLMVEIYAASWGLPLQHPTAPQATRSWRTAPARIAADARPDCRTLSLSGITYDPGDLADLERIYGPFLDARGLYDLVVAAKAKEVLAPNLGLLFRLPSLDGFDGGLLPTRRFVQAMELFLPPDRVVADGRLREQLREVPDARLLSLFGVCYVIVDKVFDAWRDDVYYDLAFGETLDAARPLLSLGEMPAFPATSVGLVTHLVGGAHLPDGAPVAELIAVFADGAVVRKPLVAGQETAEGADTAPGLAHSRDLPPVRWRYDAPGQDYVAAIDLGHAGLLQSLDLRLLDPSVTLFVRGASLIDRVSDSHTALLATRQPWRRIHSGDVKVYENTGVLPRAFLAPDAELSPDDAATLTRMQDPTFDPARTVLLAEGAPRMGGTGAVTILSQTPERLRLRVNANAPSTLVLADAWYPGWQAWLDPKENESVRQSLPIHRADLFLRAISIPAGEHELLLEFRPAPLRWGAIITACALLLFIIIGAWSRAPLAL